MEWAEAVALALTALVMVLKWLLSDERRAERGKRREEISRDVFDRALYRGDADLVGRMLAKRVRSRTEGR